MINNNNDLAIVILSCDKYKDLWDLYFAFFHKYWKDCPYPIYLVSNFEKYEDKRIINICVGDDVSWSNNLKIAIEKVKERNVLLLLDDVFLNKAVDTQKVNSLIDQFTLLNANYLKLIPMPKPDVRINEELGEINKGSLYRSTAVFTIWNKDTLQKILVPSENAWQFEEFGSIRSDEFDGFYSTYRNTFSWIHGVVRGKWIAESVTKIKKEGFSVDTTIQGIHRPHSRKLLLRELRHFVFMKYIPSKYRRRIRSIFK